MIHFFHVWETPVPTDFESAARLVESHIGRTAPLNRKQPVPLGVLFLDEGSGRWHGVAFAPTLAEVLLPTCAARPPA